MTLANGIKIALPGEDANTIPNTPENIKKFSLLSHTENFSLLKVKTSQKVTITYGNTETIAHNLGYTPIVWVFIKIGDNLYPVYNDTSGTYMYVDGTNLVICNKELSSWPDGSNDFYYYIFYDQI